MATTSYAIGLGSNRRTRHGSPAATLIAALNALGMEVVARSAVIETAPVGPGSRRYANMAVIVRSDLSPPALLALAKRVERAFGRRPGRRWGDRPLDIDLLLWSGGRWRDRTLTMPHAALAQRRFAVDPLAAIAADMVVNGKVTVRHVRARLTRPRPIHKSSPRTSL